ncbi:MAG: DUF488 domain-containing protein [Phycisphaerae bacterium]|nr:DUF488 domain-containing protein [Phycisphaerae bacterium]
MTREKPNTLYTIGHSNHKIDDFIHLLRLHEITCIMDVRSTPYSRYSPQFNHKPLALALRTAGIEYTYLGDRLGARPDNTHCSGANHVNFEYLAQTEAFKSGLARLIEVASEYRVALMCAEKEPLQCHRCILICRHLKPYTFCIKHILADGSTENHGDTEHRLIMMLKIEPTLFEPTKTDADLIEQAYDRQAEIISYNSESEISTTTHNTVKP